MNAGKLDRRIDILAATNIKDELGQPIQSWTVVATVWAERLELRVADATLAAGRQSVTTGRFRIRWRNGLTTAHRIAVAGVQMAILSIDQPDRRQSLVLTVEAA